MIFENTVLSASLSHHHNCQGCHNYDFDDHDDNVSDDDEDDHNYDDDGTVMRLTRPRHNYDFDDHDDDDMTVMMMGLTRPRHL